MPFFAIFYTYMTKNFEATFHTFNSKLRKIRFLKLVHNHQLHSQEFVELYLKNCLIGSMYKYVDAKNDNSASLDTIRLVTWLSFACENIRAPNLLIL